VKKICISETNIFYAWFVQTELLSKAFAQIWKIFFVFPLFNFFLNTMDLFFTPQKCITLKKNSIVEFFDQYVQRRSNLAQFMRSNTSLLKLLLNTEYEI
jgi:hypothetical protein